MPSAVLGCLFMKVIALKRHWNAGCLSYREPRSRRSNFRLIVLATKIRVGAGLRSHTENAISIGTRCQLRNRIAHWDSWMPFLSRRNDAISSLCQSSRFSERWIKRSMERCDVNFTTHRSGARHMADPHLRGCSQVAHSSSTSKGPSVLFAPSVRNIFDTRLRLVE